MLCLLPRLLLLLLLGVVTLIPGLGMRLYWFGTQKASRHSFDFALLLSLYQLPQFPVHKKSSLLGVLIT